MTLDDLVTQLKAAHGDRLLGVVVYGSTAGEPGAKSGHNVLVVVRSLDVGSVQAGGAIARAWSEAGNAVPLTLTADEWKSSVDVFAIEHADIADRHRVILAAGGFAPTAREAVRDTHIRHQLEYESLALTLAVRSAVAMAGNDVKDLRAILANQAGHAVALMRATLRLAGRPASGDAAAICRDAGALAGFDPGPFLAADRQRHGTATVARADAARLVGGFHDGLAQLVRWLDGHGRQGATR